MVPISTSNANHNQDEIFAIHSNEIMLIPYIVKIQYYTVVAIVRAADILTLSLSSGWQNPVVVCGWQERLKTKPRQ